MVVYVNPELDLDLTNARLGHPTRFHHSPVPIGHHPARIAIVDTHSQRSAAMGTTATLANIEGHTSVTNDPELIEYLLAHDILVQQYSFKESEYAKQINWVQMRCMSQPTKYGTWCAKGTDTEQGQSISRLIGASLYLLRTLFSEFGNIDAIAKYPVVQHWVELQRKDPMFLYPSTRAWGPETFEGYKVLATSSED